MTPEFKPIPQKVMNFIAGPGAGKSTMCADVYSRLKWAGFNVEMAREFAKDLVWEGSHHLLGNQLLITSEQYRRQRMLVDKVDLILTDSPLLLSAMYGRKYPYIEPLAQGLWSEFDNLTVYLKRTKEYEEAGRMQTEQEAQALDLDVLDVAVRWRVPLELAAGIPEEAERLFELAVRFIKGEHL